MESLSQLERFVVQLSPTDFEKFREWFWDYENEKWNIKIEKDIATDKLSGIANAASNDFKAGKFTRL